MVVIVPSVNHKEHLFYLLQDIYFNNIDNADADAAIEAMHPQVRWVHNQVWEHDGHKSSIKDILNGQDEVKRFLRNRVKETQVEGIIHKVENVISDGELGAFKANVIGTDNTKKAFIGIVKLQDNKIIYYRVLPEE
jgi:hypothetical protein